MFAALPNARQVAPGARRGVQDILANRQEEPTYLGPSWRTPG